MTKSSHGANPLATRAARDAFTALSGMPDEFAEVLAEFPQIDESALKVFLALRTATRRVENVVAQWLEPFDLTMTKLDVLHLLASRSRRGASVSMLRDFLKMTQPNVTFVLETTGRPAEDFETTARRYAAMPFARPTLANRSRAIARFALVPFVPGYDFDARARRQLEPVPVRARQCMASERWHAEHDPLVRAGTNHAPHGDGAMAVAGVR